MKHGLAEPLREIFTGVITPILDSLLLGSGRNLYSLFA